MFRHNVAPKDFGEVLGYVDTLTPADYLRLYERNGLAARICDTYPDSTWRSFPELASDNEDLAKAFWDMFSDKQTLTSTLHRFDRVVQLGRYGVLHLGTDDGRPTWQSLQARPRMKLLYAQPYMEQSAPIIAWDKDPHSERYGRPVMYQVGDLKIHHTRVIHAAEHILENESLGEPRLKRVHDDLFDLKKVTGSSAETFWQNAATMLAFVADSDTEWSPSEKADLRKQLEDMSAGLQRWLRLRGVEPHRIASPVADPRSHYEMFISMLAAATGIPQRKLVGSERGELASSQDEHDFNARITERRENFAGPRVIAPLVTWLQKYNFLPPGVFDVIWPEDVTVDPMKRADVALKKAQALQTYLNTLGADMLVPHEVFLGWIGVEDTLKNPEDLDESDGDIMEAFRVGKFES